MPADHGDDQDAFFIFERPWIGDVDVTVLVENATGEVGIMLRENDEALARYVLCGLRSEGREVVLQYRPEAGWYTPVPVRANDLSAPAWLRLTRVGSSFNALFSRDGQTWKAVRDPLILDLPSAINLGLFVADDGPSSATLSNLRITVP